MQAMPDPESNLSKSMTIPNDTAYLSKARMFIKEVIAKTPMDSTQHMRVVLAVDEALSNVIEHAYENAEEGVEKTIQLAFEGDENCLIVTIIDQGNHFDPSHIPDVNMNDHVKGRHKGGLGIFMIRQIMDEIEYSFKDGEYNILKLVKYYEERA
jgi:anti-sigma regulatory factor (Ser/Thr protein kinase)